MSTTSQVIYQPCIAGARGSLRTGVAVACRTPEEGICRTERASAYGFILGAEVVRMIHDTAADEFGDPELLGRFGRVPEAD